MKSILRAVTHGELQYPCLMFVCPGCKEIGGTGLHMLPVNTDKKHPAWEWDRNFERPTLAPSILTRMGPAENQAICHSFLRGGVFEFLNDSTHSLAGTHAPMPDLPDWVIKEGETS